MNRAQADGLTARLSESEIAWQRIPTVSFVQGILSPSKGRGGPGPRREGSGTSRPRGDHRVRHPTVTRIRQHPCRAGGILRSVRPGVVNEVAYPVLDSVDHGAARDEPESVS